MSWPIFRLVLGLSGVLTPVLAAQVPAPARSIQVLDSKGHPISGAVVFVARPQVASPDSLGTTGEKGSIEVPPLRDGARLLVLHPKYLPLETSWPDKNRVVLSSGSPFVIEASGPHQKGSTGLFEGKLFPREWLGLYDVESLPALLKFRQAATFPGGRGYVAEVWAPGLERLRLEAVGRKKAALRKGVALSGSVEFASGESEGPVLIRLLKLPSHPQQALERTTERVAFVRGDKRFALDGICPKDLLGFLVAPFSGAPLWRPLVQADLLRPVTVRIPKGSEARGRVVCGPDPLSGIQVEARLALEDAFGLSVSRNVRVAPDGSFIVPHLSPGSLQVLYSAVQRRQGRASLALGNSPEYELGTFCPGAFVKIEGVVLFENQKPVEGARATYGDFAAASDRTGNFSLLVSGPSEGQLRVETPGLLPWQRSVRLSDQLSPFHIVLSPGARVAGRVVDSETQKPLSRFSVKLFFTERPGEAVFDKTLDTRDGAFESNPLEPEPYRLFLEADGHITREIAVEKLASGEKHDLGVVALDTGLRVSGRVLSPDGKPQPDAKVAARLASQPGYMKATEGFSLFSTQSDSEGRFAISRLKPAEYLVTVAAEGFAEVVREVAVSDGDVDLGDVQVSPGCLLKGTVRDTEDLAVASAVIEARRGSLQNLAGQRSTVTDSEGHFSFQNLAPDSYGVVTKVGGRKVQESVTRLEEDPCDKEIEITVGAVTLEGTLMRRGQPLARRPLTLLPLGRPEDGGPSVYLSTTSGSSEAVSEVLGSGSGRVSSRTDDRGFFRITHLQPGIYRLAVEDRGRALARKIELPPAGTLRQDFDFSGFRVAGFVESAAKGEPVDGADVTLLLPPNREVGDMAVTAGGGRFQFEDVLENRFSLAVSKPGYRTAEVPVAESSAGDVRVRLEEAKLAVRGRVQRQDGSPVQGAAIVWSLETGVRPRGGNTSSGPDGRFEIADLEPGSLSLLATAGGHGTSFRTLVLASASGEQSLDLTLYPSGTLKVMLSTEDDPRTLRLFAQNAKLTFLLFRAGLQPTAASPGLFVWRGLPPERYRISSLRASREVAVPAGQEVEADLRRP